jgi:hypothetical protein
MQRIYIKDLYDSKRVINSFAEVEFESLYAFVNAYKKDLFKLTKKLKLTIPINTIEDFNIVVEVGLKSKLFELGFLNLYITDADLLEEIIRNKLWLIKTKQFRITTNPIIKSNGRHEWININEFKAWSSKNPLVIKAKITYENYRTIVDDLISIYNIKGLRFFEIYFDYHSFEEMKLEELHEFEFRISQLRIWQSATKDFFDKERTVDKIVLNSTSHKKIFISNDLKLYLTKEAFEDGIMLFDLGNNLDKNGETLSVRELSELRQYIDLVPQAMANTRNWSFIDFYQNVKVMGNINECPYLNNIVGDAFGSF